MTHRHSAESLHDEQAQGRISRRAEAVLKVLQGATRPLTDREIADALGFSDLNAVRPRITELIALGFVAEMRAVRCETTGKTVRTTRALHWAEIQAARAAAAAAPAPIQGVQAELFADAPAPRGAYSR